MLDITMCKGEGCPVKDKCRRHTATPDYYQAYFAETPFKDGKCDFYWGEQAQSIFEQLKDIVNGTESKDTATESGGTS